MRRFFPSCEQYCTGLVYGSWLQCLRLMSLLPLPGLPLTLLNTGCFCTGNLNIHFFAIPTLRTFREEPVKKHPVQRQRYRQRLGLSPWSKPTLPIYAAQASGLDQGGASHPCRASSCPPISSSYAALAPWISQTPEVLFIRNCVEK